MLSFSFFSLLCVLDDILETLHLAPSPSLPQAHQHLQCFSEHMLPFWSSVAGLVAGGGCDLNYSGPGLIPKKCGRFFFSLGALETAQLPHYSVADLCYSSLSYSLSSHFGS